MNQGKKYPDWFLWAWENGLLLFICGALLPIVVITGVALYLDYRLDYFEDRLQFVPTSSYQTPNLADYDAGDTNVDTLPVQQLVYVPVYSHVYYQGGSPFPLETTLSIRNTSPDKKLYLTSVEYFDTSGKLVKKYLDQLIQLAPLQTIELLVESRDSSGGSGANFLVEWRAESAGNKPVIEAVMVGKVGTQAICFVRNGIEISTAKADNPADQ